MTEKVERRLAAVLSADVVGYSRLMGVDEEGTYARLKTHLEELLKPKIDEHRGRVIKFTATACWRTFPAPSMPCAAPLRCSVRWWNAMPRKTNNAAWNSASASIWAISLSKRMTFLATA